MCITKKAIMLLVICMIHLASGRAQVSRLPQAKQMDDFLNGEIRTNGIPGMAVAIVQNGQLVYLRTFGKANIEWDAPVDEHTVFQIASVTKLFTSTLVLKWVQDGKLRLDDPISQYFSDAPPAWQHIQVKHLLSHQSGLPWPSGIGGFIGTKSSGSNTPPSREEIYSSIKDSAASFAPGTKESYINGDHFILQMILEKIAGKPFPEILQEEVLSKLGMHDSGYDWEIRALPMQVMKALPRKSQLFTKGKTAPNILKAFYNASSYDAAGLYLSISDAVKWAIALDRGNFINKVMVDSFQAPMPLNGSFTKLGWIKEKMYGQITYGHSGGPGLGQILRIPEKKLTIIVLNNDADLYPYLGNALLGIYLGAAELKEKDLKTKTIDRGYEAYF
jgi:CubicO group peptidase (beta-lactamase class C family)